MLDATFVFLHELSHFTVASFLSILLFWKFHSKKLIPTIFAVTFLLDLDHLFDYFYFAQNLKFWEYFGSVDFFTVSGRNFVLIHSWELAIFLGIWAWLKKSPLILSISLSLGGHLLVDQLTYTPHLLGYFLFFRALNNFSLPWFNGL